MPAAASAATGCEGVTTLLRDHTSEILLVLGGVVGLAWPRFLGWLGRITCRAFHLWD